MATYDDTAPLLRMLVKSKVCYQIAPAADVTAKAKDGLGGGGVGGLDVGVHILRVRVVKKDAYALLSHLIWF